MQQNELDVWILPYLLDDCVDFIEGGSADADIHWLSLTTDRLHERFVAQVSRRDLERSHDLVSRDELETGAIKHFGDQARPKMA